MATRVGGGGGLTTVTEIVEEMVEVRRGSLPRPAVAVCGCKVAPVPHAPTSDARRSPTQEWADEGFAIAARPGSKRKTWCVREASVAGK